MSRHESGPACRSMLQLQGELIMVNDAKARSERINSEMLDSFDEELELEIDDDRLARLLNEASEHPEPGTLDRRIIRTVPDAASWRSYRTGSRSSWWSSSSRAAIPPAGRGHQAHHQLNLRVAGSPAAGSQRRETHLRYQLRDSSSAGGEIVVRPQLVQSRRRRARHGLLHGRAVRGILPFRS